MFRGRFRPYAKFAGKAVGLATNYYAKNPQQLGKHIGTVRRYMSNAKRGYRSAFGGSGSGDRLDNKRTRTGNKKFKDEDLPQVQYTVGGDHSAIVSRIQRRRRKLTPRTKRRIRFNKKIKKIVNNAFSNYNLEMPQTWEGYIGLETGKNKKYKVFEFLNNEELRKLHYRTRGASTYAFGVDDNDGTETKDLFMKDKLWIKYFKAHITICQTGDDMNAAPMRVKVYHYTYKSAIPTTNTNGATLKDVESIITNAAALDVVAGPRPKLNDATGMYSLNAEFVTQNNLEPTDFWWLNKLVTFTKVETKYMKKGDSFDLDWKFYPKVSYEPFKKTQMQKLVTPNITHGVIITLENALGDPLPVDPQGKTGQLEYQAWYKVGWKVETLKRPDTVQKSVNVV